MRTSFGFILIVVSVASTWAIIGKGRIEVLVFIFAIAWVASILLTDKYVNKYPKRYLTYLGASHAKAAIIMAICLWILSRIAGGIAAPQEVFWTGYLLFVFADALASLPYKRDIKHKPTSDASTSRQTEEFPDGRSISPISTPELIPIDTQAIKKHVRSHLDRPVAEFIENNLPDLQGVIREVLVIHETSTIDRTDSGAIGLLVSQVRFNDVRRLNRYFLSCVDMIPMGGYLAGRYVPLENVVKKLKRRYQGSLYWFVFFLHFFWYRAFPKIPWLNMLYFALTKGRNRVLSKAEIWGRLSYCGMRVTAESGGDGEICLLAQRVAYPIRNKRPSYYPIVALEKVGLDGEIIHTHKIRTMFPFSEFLQKRIFEDNGLAPTGKFANDFRLTEYGGFLRKYWLDELPQVFDWLQGEVKLVGMRATSRHFLSLYPRELYDLYIQIKPGLIPPIFGESTNGLEAIAGIEMAYLQRYREQPFRTDVRYLIQTFTDIVFRGVRSK